MAGSSFSTSFTIDVRGLRRLSRDLRAAAPAMAVELPTGLKAAGSVVAEEAKSQSSWSTRIPGSVKTRASGTTATVIAGGSAAPDAAPFENRGKTGAFRHPVFGNVGVWVSQQARPFLAPSLEAKSTELTAAVEAVLDRVIEGLTRG